MAPQTGPPRPTVTSADTVDEIVASAKRRKGDFRLRHGFLQRRLKGNPVPGPVAELVRSRDRRALLLFLLLATKASAEPFNVALPSAVWARALGIELPETRSARSAISRTWKRLEDLHLVSRSRHGRSADVYMRREDGTDEDYTNPGGPGDPYFKVPMTLWTEGPDGGGRWYEELTLPELVVLLIGRKLGDRFLLPHDKAQLWYGIGSDTIYRGLTGLERRGLLDKQVTYKVTPLSPTGSTVEHRYTLQPPFGPVGRVSGEKPKKRSTKKTSGRKKSTAKKSVAAKKVATRTRKPRVN